MAQACYDGSRKAGYEAGVQAGYKPAGKRCTGRDSGGVAVLSNGLDISFVVLLHFCLT